MKIKRFCIALSMLSLLPSMLFAVDWQRLAAPIMSPWGEQINPESVWEEYPRPQLVRSEWTNLNGIWTFYRKTNTTDLPYVPNTRVFTREILVPFGVESALSGLMYTDYSSVAKSR